MAAQEPESQNAGPALDILRDEETPMKHRLEATMGATQDEATTRDAIIQRGVELTEGTASDVERAELKALLETAVNEFGIAVSPKEIAAARKHDEQEHLEDGLASEDESDETSERTHAPSEGPSPELSEGDHEETEVDEASNVDERDDASDEATLSIAERDEAGTPDDTASSTAFGEPREHDASTADVQHPLGQGDATDDESAVTDDAPGDGDVEEVIDEADVESPVKNGETDDKTPSDPDGESLDREGEIGEGIPTAQSVLDGRQADSVDWRVDESAEPKTIDEERIQRDIEAGDDSARPTARDRVFPDDDYVIYDRLTRRSTLAQDTLGFEYVRDDGIAVDDDHYIGLIHVTPRNWLVLNDEEKQSVFSAFVSFLRGAVQFPIQIVAIPRDFDVTHHTSNIRDADNRANHDKESPFLAHGRRRQVIWTQNAIDNRHVKDRDHYLVVRVRAEQVYSYMNKSGAFDGIPILENLVKKVKRTASSDTEEDRVASEDRCVAEVNQRRHSLREKLANTGVRTELVDDRNEMMDILYRYYNHSDSPFDEYNHATYTEKLSNIVSPGGDH